MSDPPTFLKRVRWDQALGEIRDGEIRYMMIRPDALMGLFTRLSKEARAAALQALRESVTEHGGRSLERYQRLGAGDEAALLATIAQTAPSLGWGVWTFDRPNPRAISLSVKGSPFAAGFGASDEPVCAAITGMLSAVATLVCAVPARVSELECVSCGARRCLFEIVEDRGQRTED